jgi:hypothetical protein
MHDEERVVHIWRRESEALPDSEIEALWSVISEAANEWKYHVIWRGEAKLGDLSRDTGFRIRNPITDVDIQFELRTALRSARRVREAITEWIDGDIAFSQTPKQFIDARRTETPSIRGYRGLEFRIDGTHITELSG